jgi:ubiquinone/menaquinone biosynthesis C-methylase UbiE
MPRNWEHLEQYLDLLADQVYAEAITKSHRLITARSFERFVLPIKDTVTHALDIGCGQGVALELFAKHGIRATGITLSDIDAEVCRQKGWDVQVMDQTFLSFSENAFDLLWARHCLEHSPMPLLTLFEYARVLRTHGWLYIEVPQPDSIHVDNPNHYSLFSDRGWRSLFKRAHLLVAAHVVYTIPHEWKNEKAPGGKVAMDDYYYAYWLKKCAPDEVEAFKRLR